MTTRKALLDAARAVFERDGYTTARITDICAGADVAVGSFYTYFHDKDEAFTAVLTATREEMLHPDLKELESNTPGASIEAANRAYLVSYRKNSKMMGALYEAASIDPRYRALLKQRTDLFVRRNSRLIARLQGEGRADPSLDPREAGQALSQMVSRAAYSVYVLGERQSLERLVATLTLLWVNALRLSDADALRAEAVGRGASRGR
jgi:AcrR family transcriptional regulator